MLNFSSQRIDKMIAQDKLYSLRALRTPDGGKILAKILMVLMLLFVVILFFPWQQNIRGVGKVTALNPMNRPQTVQTVIAGQIKRWHVREGQFVKKGDTIITISEVKEKYFDPNLLQRLSEQIVAKKGGIKSKGQKANALERQIVALRNTLKNKVEQTQVKLDAERIKFENAQSLYTRNKLLYQSGNIPLSKFQDIESKFQASRSDYRAAEIELSRVEAEYMDKISKAESDLNSTRAELFDAEAEISKMKNEFENLRIRNDQYQVLAPQNGYVVKAMLAGIGETVKEGDAVCTIMPEASDMAVEMYVSAMDVPLISKGRRVRIQFDGWPALQFSGWPSVSVGTFGGNVAVIDYVNSGPGEFRILITPDKQDQDWPPTLRVGSGIKGWVMLDDVPVWYEIWRQLNGFPPSLYQVIMNEKPNVEKQKTVSSSEKK